MVRVLVLQRDAANRRRLRALLENGDFEISEATAAAAAQQAHSNRIRAVLADAALLAEGDLMTLADPVPVVLIAATANVSEAVDCMRRGAADYLAWPCEPDRLVAAVGTAAAQLGTCDGTSGELAMILGESPPIRELKKCIAEAARSNKPVLIQAEPGTGKELAVRALHDASDRRYAPLITLNCATTPEASIESALFGYDLGLGTGRGAARGLIGAARDGTLLIKEIDRLPVAAQTRLLRFLDGSAQPSGRRPAPASPELDMDVRVVATTSQNLGQLAQNGHFLALLIERLARTTLHLPPLRERGDDIERIARAVLDRTATKRGKRGVQFTAAALGALRDHAWPGNVRELNHAVARAATLCDGPAIDTDLLPLASAASAASTGERPAADLQRSTTGSLEDFFVRFVLDNQDQYTETELASQLGISRKSLWERRQRLNIPRRRTRKRGPRQPSAGL